MTQPTVTLAELVDDFRAECAELDALVAGLPAAAWRWLTPAIGWTVADQIQHLSKTDELTALAVLDPDAYSARRSAAADAVDPDGPAEPPAEPSPADILASWRINAAASADALSAAAPGSRLPWVGRTMSPLSMTTARIMETWAHGVDIADTVGADKRATDRLRHVADLGVRTRDFAFNNRGRPVPAAAFRVELTGPGGQLWTWGPSDAVESVTGTALDFCLIVTQRRHRSELALVSTGPNADEWLDIAQAFAGPPGPGREPGPATSVEESPSSDSGPHQDGRPQT